MPLIQKCFIWHDEAVKLEPESCAVWVMLSGWMGFDIVAQFSRLLVLLVLLVLFRTHRVLPQPRQHVKSGPPQFVLFGIGAALDGLQKRGRPAPRCSPFGYPALQETGFRWRRVHSVEMLVGFFFSFQSTHQCSE